MNALNLKEVTRDSHLCSLHFKEDDYEPLRWGHSVPILKIDVVPCVVFPKLYENVSFCEKSESTYFDLKPLSPLPYLSAPSCGLLSHSSPEFLTETNFTKTQPSFLEEKGASAETNAGTLSTEQKYEKTEKVNNDNVIVSTGALKAPKNKLKRRRTIASKPNIDATSNLDDSIENFAVSLNCVSTDDGSSSPKIHIKIKITRLPTSYITAPLPKKELYHCNYCNKGFTSKQNLKIHINIHLENKPFVCEVCEKTFTQQANCIRHKMIHSKERRFICNYCRRTFNDKTTFTRHILIHTRNYSFSCDQCESKFTTKYQLVNHARKHTCKVPYVCTYCNCTFKRRLDCMNHIKLHEYQPTHKCDYCPKTFRLRAYMLRHVKIHLSNELYTCGMCKKKYKMKHNYHKHIGNKHGSHSAH